MGSAWLFQSNHLYSSYSSLSFVLSHVPTWWWCLQPQPPPWLYKEVLGRKQTTPQPIRCVPVLYIISLSRGCVKCCKIVNVRNLLHWSRKMMTHVFVHAFMSVFKLNPFLLLNVSSGAPYSGLVQPPWGKDRAVCVCVRHN